MGGVGPAPDPGAIVVAESRSQIAFLFGFLALVFAVALGRGVAGATTTAGRVAILVIFGLLIAVVIRSWIMVVRRINRLEVGENAITFVRGNGQVATLSRQQGDELHFIKHRAAPRSRIRTLGLIIVGTDSVLLLPGFFSRQEVRQACRSRGWRVDN